MTDIDELVIEAREWEASESSWGNNGLVSRLADALESVYRDSLTGQAEHARWQEKAERYRAAIRDALKENLFVVGTVPYGREYRDNIHRGLTRALKETT